MLQRGPLPLHRLEGLVGACALSLMVPTLF
jgi:hypothetical protein